MRTTVCELPHAPELLDAAWRALCAHTRSARAELVLLPEFAFVEPVWETLPVDPARWAAAVALSDAWIARLPELGCRWVVGARPVTDHGRRLNEGFAWSADGGYQPLRRKCHLPDEPGGWEAHWFERGDASFPSFHAGPLTFGLNICSELWALDTYGAYAARGGVQAILSPRSTAAATTSKWLAVGTVAAVRTGAYSLSSNRVDAAGTYGGAGWIISPDGALLAQTSAEQPFCTVDIDLHAVDAARSTYPRYVFAAPPAPAP